MRVLHVEDNPGDLVLTREALKRSEIDCSVHEARDVRSAQTFLSRTGRHADAPEVDLVLLDLNLIGGSGHEVLAWVRSQRAFEKLPVVVLTSSSAQSDFQRAKNVGATGYCVKPRELREFVSVVDELMRFWGAAGVAEPGSAPG